MIEAKDVMPLLLDAHPGFEPRWREIEVKNSDESSPAGRLNYVDAGDFVRHLVNLRLAEETKDFPAIFAVIDRLVTEGDDYVRNLGTIGYLEGLQMLAVTKPGLDPETEFRPFLGPMSERWWERINRFWEGDLTALKDTDP